jgi:immune inhibitor A
MKRSWIFPCTTTVFIGLMLCFLVGCGLVSLIYIQQAQMINGKEPLFAVNPATETPTVIRSIDLPRQSDNSLDSEIFPFVLIDTLETLENIILPASDLIDLASRLGGKENIPLTMEPPDKPFLVGMQRNFWATNVDTVESFQITATLRYISDHVYFWIQDGVSYNRQDLQDLVETFEQKIYPTNRELFGSEWKPGVDGDPRLYIVYARGLGQTLVGYYSSADQYHPMAHKYSNANEIFFLNVDNLSLGHPATYSVLAHEFQHMIHWNLDRNEETWLNEGISELASFINGYPSSHERSYVANPSIQLNDWPINSSQTSAHYGASFLFFTYFLDRFGEEATRALVAHHSNGLASIDAVLEELKIRDLVTGDQINADDVYIDWLVTNALQDGSVSDGRFTYSNYLQAPQISATKSLTSCPNGPFVRSVHQYGFDAIHITCSGDHTLYFEGSTEVDVVPEDPYSGDFAFWSNRGDESNMTLTQAFDFSEHQGTLSLSYLAWFDIEENYDYLYLVASLDGESWQILTTPSGSPEDTSGNSYGWAYTGVSGGCDSPCWINEIVDISQFAGQQVHLRFEYVTDSAVHGEGFLLDDVTIPEIGYFSDFEKDDGGWEANGWARIRNTMPQFYRLALIILSDAISVEYIFLEPDNTAIIPLSLIGELDEAILIVTGTTRYTRQKAPYQVEVK